MIPRQAKYISFVFKNTITDSISFKISYPYDTKIFINHAEIYKRFKFIVGEHEKIDPELVTTYHEIVPAMGSDEVVYEWPGGISLKIPIEMSEWDWQIVKKQLEVLQMSFGDPSGEIHQKLLH